MVFINKYLPVMGMMIAPNSRARKGEGGEEEGNSRTRKGEGKKKMGIEPESSGLTIDRNTTLLAHLNPEAAY